MSGYAKLAVLLVVSSFLLPLGCGQSGTAASGSSGPKPKVSELVNLTGGPRIDLPGRVSMLVQALDRDGDPVAGLTSDDFRLFENGDLVSPSETQQQLLPVPRVYRLLSFLLLDLSASISRDPDALAAEIAAAKAYVKIVTRDPSHRVGVGFFFGVDEISPATIFDPVTRSFVPLGFSGDRDRIEEALDNVGLIEVFDDSTNLYGAVIEAAEGLFAESQALIQRGEVEFVSRALVTFTDGSHNANDLTLSDARDALPLAGDAYTIGVGTEVDQRALNELGPDGAVTASRLSRLQRSFEEIGEILSDQANSFYRIGYISPKNNGAASPELRVEAENGAGTALLETDFSPRFFSSGAGFLEVVASGAADVEEGVCTAVDVDERDRAVALIHATEGSGVAVGRYLEDGTPDPSFGTDGVFALPTSVLSPGAILNPRDLSVSPRDGRIHVVAEQTFEASTDANLVVIRFDNGDDSIDFVNLPPNLSGDPLLVDVANDIEVDRDGRVWIGGASQGAAGSYRLIVRLKRDLDFSSNFGDHGVLVHATNPAMPMDEVTDLAVDRSEERIVTVGPGYSAARGGADMQVVSFREDGRLDTRFSTDGIVSNPVVFQAGLVGKGQGNAILVDHSDDSLVVAGSVELPDGVGGIFERPAFWRIDGDGDLDVNFTGGFSNPFAPGGPFATPGVVTLGDPLTANDEVLFGDTALLNGVQLSDDGDLIAAGSRYNAEGHEDAIWLSVGPTGLLRSTYNGTGFMIEDGSVFDGGDEAITSIALRSDGTTASCGWTAKRNTVRTVPLLFIDDDSRRSLD